ncbi:hypothetical protein AURDEDRAFT_173591 [Auricularia subglabra TFB-10046 SS5]|uniref:Uncharacterized protein n=1 Tax=Auricularia subglabra (strain TFB-10046 / SS5) TaxID=717982 RepID=J0DAJ5_AURST|nr:hypothetical protein AURDEDRAFT_173591 [Auricularia subglabra TFB-10046 SS5]
MLAIQAADPSLPYYPVISTEVTNKANAKLYLSIFDQFGLANDGMKQNVTDYIQTVGGAARTDNAVAGNFTLRPLLYDSAVFLFCLGLLTLVNTWVPKHRYIWGSIFSRWLMAIVLGLLTLLANNDSDWQRIQDNAVLGAIVAVAFVIQFAVDYGLIWVASWRQKRIQ